MLWTVDVTMDSVSLALINFTFKAHVFYNENSRGIVIIAATELLSSACDSSVGFNLHTRTSQTSTAMLSYQRKISEILTIMCFNFDYVLNPVCNRRKKKWQ